MALGYDYLTFNGEKLPWATSDSTAYEHVETVELSEAGYELAITTRLNKPTYTYTFHVTSFWRDKLLAICSELSGTLTINGDAGHTVRPRIQTKELEQDSQLTAGTDGLYNVTINFYER